ncbi:MAG: hypothetical protein AAGG01_11425 [Planctomycetota bacterium]
MRPTFFLNGGLVRGLPLTVLAMVDLLILTNIAPRVSSPRRGDGVEQLFGVYWLLAIVSLLLIVCLAGRSLPLQTRVSEFERALPVTMRRVVLERLATAWLLLFATFFAGSLIWLARVEGDQRVLEWTQLVRRGFLASGVSVLLLGAYRPARARLSSPEAAGVLIVSTTLWIHSGSRLGAAGDWDLAAVLAALLAFLWFRLPTRASAIRSRRFRLPAAPASASAHVRSLTSLPTRLLGPLNWTLLRSSVLRPRTALFTLVSLYAFPPVLARGDGPELPILLILLLGPFTMLRNGMNVLHGIDAMPLRRERVLRVAGVASLCHLMLLMALTGMRDHTYGRGDLLGPGVSVEEGTVRLAGGHGRSRTHVKVPPELWVVTADRSEAQIVAPWGETCRALLHPLFVNANTFAFNPYDVGPDNSVRLLAWQVKRAIVRVHGSEA